MPDFDPDHAFETLLRWIQENVFLIIGVYRSEGGTLHVDPRLRVNEDGHLRHRGQYLREPSPEVRREHWMLNSPAALTICCYIAALGKVVAGRRFTRQDGGDLRVFESFIGEWMPDFVDECRQKAHQGFFAPAKAVNKYHPIDAGTQALYKMFRNGFVHQFIHPDTMWARVRDTKEHWFKSSTGELVLNIDRLAVSFLNGVSAFKLDWEARAAAGTVTKEEFVRRLLFI